MRIAEIYASVQGETRAAGRPCVLVRTTGCDLRCTYCDTGYAFYGGNEMAPEAIVEAARELGPTLVLLTGGEPLLQAELPLLAEQLLGAGFEVMCETSGAHDIACLPDAVARIVDCKTPSSQETGKMRWVNFEGGRLRKSRDSVKFVLSDQDDYGWARRIIARYDLGNQAEILLSPVHGALDPRELVGWILRDRMPARLNVQMHKYIWGADAQGV